MMVYRHNEIFNYYDHQTEIVIFMRAQVAGPIMPAAITNVPRYISYYVGGGKVGPLKNKYKFFSKAKFATRNKASMRQYSITTLCIASFKLALSVSLLYLRT